MVLWVVTLRSAVSDNHVLLICGTDDRQSETSSPLLSFFISFAVLTFEFVTDLFHSLLNLCVNGNTCNKNVGFRRGWTEFFRILGCYSARGG